MALNTTTDPFDFAQYMQLEQHLMNVLQQNAQLPLADRPLTSAIVTEMNDTLQIIQDNLQLILTAAAAP